MRVFSSPITDDCLPITEQTPHLRTFVKTPGEKAAFVYTA